MQLNDTEFKDREKEILKEVEELSIKPIIFSIEHMDRFEGEEIKKVRPVNNNWYDWLID